VEVDTVPVCLGTHTFTIPGVYYYDCTTYGHAGSGMVGSITVHLPGCMDSLACNYDDAATEDNESCLFIGDACDDGDETTQDDVIQEDCGCAGLTITLSSTSTLQVFNSIGKLVEETGPVSSWVFNVSDWKKGFYTVKTHEGKTQTFIVE
jgi:hypothetical protein